MHLFESKLRQIFFNCVVYTLRMQTLNFLDATSLHRASRSLRGWLHLKKKYHEYNILYYARKITYKYI